jgi:hypothetical protein
MRVMVAVRSIAYKKRMRNHPTNIIAAMVEMLELFDGICEDRDTLQQLIKMTQDREKWEDGHALFRRIRQKTLAAIKRGDQSAEAQYVFEEICAKTLYNLGGYRAPFDADSAFWVIPLGIELGRRKGFTEPSQVTGLLDMSPV